MVYSDGRSKRKKDINIRFCLTCGKEIPRNTKQGEKRIRPAQYIKAKFCSRKCRGISQKIYNKGENNPRWKGGTSTENERIRGSNEYKLWRLSVFQRDGWTCQKCKDRGKKINAHHIEPFSKNKSLRFNLNNGITFCEKCHKNFHKQYGDNNGINQLLSFIN